MDRKVAPDHKLGIIGALVAFAILVLGLRFHSDPERKFGAATRQGLERIGWVFCDAASEKACVVVRRVHVRFSGKCFFEGHPLVT